MKTIRVNGWRIAGAVATIALCVSCAGVRQIRPLEPGESAVNLSLGGPITNYVGDAYLPMPFIGLGYNRGVRSWLDIESGWDVTHALYGNLSIEGGANFRPWRAVRWRPSLIVSPRAHIVTDFDSYVRLYPVLGLTGAWEINERWRPYIGVENWWELAGEREDGLVQDHRWIFAPYVGISYARTRWQFQLECRWYTPNIDSEYGRAAQNLGIGDQGILGVLIGVGRTFGGGK